MSIVFPGVEVEEITRGAGISGRRSVAAASTANVASLTTLANGGTLDGYTLVTGDRILLKNQTTTIENGVYIVQASGAPIRSEDYAEGESVSNTFMTVQHGTTNDDTVWLCTNDPGSDIVGTDGVSFVFFGGNNISTLAGVPQQGSFTSLLIQEEIDQGVGNNDVAGRAFSTTSVGGQLVWNRLDEGAVTAQQLTPSISGDYIVLMTHNLYISNSSSLTSSWFGSPDTTILGMGLFYDGNTITVSSKTKANPCVITTSSTHYFSNNQDIILTGLSGIPNGRYKATAIPASNKITIDYNNNSGNTTGGGTVAQPIMVSNTNHNISRIVHRNMLTLSSLASLTAGTTYYVQFQLSNQTSSEVRFYYNRLQLITTSS